MIQKSNFDKANEIRKRLLNGEKLTRAEYKRLRIAQEALKTRTEIRDAFIRNEV